MKSLLYKTTLLMIAVSLWACMMRAQGKYLHITGVTTAVEGSYLAGRVEAGDVFTLSGVFDSSVAPDASSGVYANYAFQNTLVFSVGDISLAMSAYTGTTIDSSTFGTPPFPRIDGITIQGTTAETTALNGLRLFVNLSSTDASLITNPTAAWIHTMDPAVFDNANTIKLEGYDKTGDHVQGRVLYYGIITSITVNDTPGAAIEYASQTATPGLLWAAGDNSFGEFGGEYPITQVHRVAGGVTDAAAGLEFSAYVRSDGTLWAMGRGVGWSSFGNLLDYEPRARQMATSVAKVEAGGDNLFYLKTDGTLWVSGRDNYGELGLGKPSQPVSGVQVASGVADMKVRNGFAIYLTTTGELWASGLNTAGQLGDGSTQTRVSFYQMTTGVAKIAAGDTHTLLVKTDGTLWGVGGNTSGQLGDGTMTNRLTPIQMANGVAAIAAGANHSLWLTTDGELWGTGGNSYGQLGDGTEENRSTAFRIDIGVSQITAGDNGTFYIKTDGSVWFTGRNTSGQSGNGGVENLLVPAQVMDGVTKVAAGDAHTLFVTSNGDLLAVGYNNYGQLGNGVTTYRSEPYLVGDDVVEVASGLRHTLMLKADGTLWGMGLNTSGQLGDIGGVYAPEPVQLDVDVVAVAADMLNTFYVTSDGKLWGMGNNDYAQLGLGHTEKVYEAMLVADQVVDVATGPGHSLFLRWDGTLWAMGHNAWGQLGDGTQTQRLSPVQVADEVWIMSVDTYHSVFVKNDGTLWAMGRNHVGQLGDGTNMDRPDPVQVANGVKFAVANGVKTLFVKTDGTLWGMGAGVSDNEFELSPVLISSEEVLFAVDGSHFVTVTGDGEMAYSGMTQRGEGGMGDIITNHTASGVIETPPVDLLIANYRTFVIQPTDLSGSLPVITKQPTGGVFPEGDTILLSVDMQKGFPLNLAAYQWRKDGINIPGAESRLLYLPALLPEDAGSYDVIITNAAGQVISDAVTVAVDASPSAAAVTFYAPNKVYNGGPQGVSVIETNPYGLEVAVTYDGSPNMPVTVGTYNVVVTITEPGYTGSASGTFSITKATQSFFFSSIFDRPYSDEVVGLSATASSDLPITFTVISGHATVSGNQLTLTGTGTVTVRASQPGNENYFAAAPVERSFTVTANRDSWSAEHFTTAELVDPLISGPSADQDTDGMTNLLEYALGLDPKSSDTVGLPEAGSTATDWTYTYTRPANRADLSYEVEVSTDLASWTTSGVTLMLVSSVDGEEIWQATYPLDAAPTLFFRLKVVQE